MFFLFFPLHKHIVNKHCNSTFQNINTKQTYRNSCLKKLLDISKGAGESSSSSETSPASGTRKPYVSRKSKSKAVPIGKRHVRSSSGYSSHNDETTFSISHAPSFSDRIHPPSRFSDLTLSDIDCDKGHKSPRNTAALSKLTREAFQINV